MHCNYNDFDKNYKNMLKPKKFDEDEDYYNFMSFITNSEGICIFKLNKHRFEKELLL